MVSELSDTSPLLDKGCGSPSPSPKNGSDGLLPLKPGIGGGPRPPPLLGKGGFGPPPPPTLLKRGGGPPPPPNTLFGSKSARNATTKLKRSSDMGYLFRKLRERMEGPSLLAAKSSLGRKKGGGNNDSASGGQSMADALAELTKRSPYFQQIQEDIQKHGKTIEEIQVSLNTFETKDMDALLTLYQQVESKLDVLTDETQVLAKFEGFPMKKLEALRMAAVLYRKLSCVVSELQNMKFEPPLSRLLDRVEKYFNKIRGEMEALDRTKDEDKKKFQSHNIHFDFSILVKIKEAIVDVSSNCIELALKERREVKVASCDQTREKAGNRQTKVDGKMLWRTFQFAYKVYSFAGGQDERGERLAKELAKEIELADKMPS